MEGNVNDHPESNEIKDEERSCLRNNEDSKCISNTSEKMQTMTNDESNIQQTEKENNITNAESCDNSNSNKNVQNEKLLEHDKQGESTTRGRGKRPRHPSPKKKVFPDIKQPEHEINLSKGNNENDNCASSLNYKLPTFSKYIPNTVPTFAEEEELHCLESPEAKKKRIESIPIRGPLQPLPKDYFQVPVINPPLISPGIVVGYTPAGQRHEVNLNFERPTRFNSEYARRQFDDATKINVRRMLHELSRGNFLPDTLDPDIEEAYVRERTNVIQEATAHFKRTRMGQNSSDPEDEDSVDGQFLKIELQLLEICESATYKLCDFPNKLSKKVYDVLKEELHPLMFLKYPVIVETIVKLKDQDKPSELTKAACALYNKITLLFNVPETQTFQQHFDFEVERLRDKTKDMSKYDVAIMTDENKYFSANADSLPREVSSDSDDETDVEDSESAVNDDVEEEPSSDESSSSSEDSQSEEEDEWIPVQQNEIWQDINRNSGGISVNESNNDEEGSIDHDDHVVNEILDDMEVIFGKNEE